MKKKTQHLSFLLLAVFSLPFLIKVVDGLFHHHHFVLQQAKPHIYPFVKKCPVLLFEFYTFIQEKTFVQFRQSFFDKDIVIKYVSLHEKPVCFSFLMRAPPRKLTYS